MVYRKYHLIILRHVAKYSEIYHETSSYLPILQTNNKLLTISSRQIISRFLPGGKLLCGHTVEVKSVRDRERERVRKVKRVRERKIKKRREERS